MKIFMMALLSVSCQAWAGTGVFLKPTDEIIISDVVEYECLQDECLDGFLPPMHFIEKDTNRRALELSAELVYRDEVSITFYRPKIAGRVIDNAALSCARYKTNFLGYDICQKYLLEDIRPILCAKLGLGEPLAQEESIGKFDPQSYPINYGYDFKKDKWSANRLGSLLVTLPSFTAIRQLRCSVN